MLTTTLACVTIGSLVPARDASLASKMKTGVSGGVDCWLTRSKPGRNHQACGTGGDDRTGTDLPIGSSASASARADPRVSPSASLCVTAVSTGAFSITCQIRGASSATSGRGGLSLSARVLPPLLDLTQQLAEPKAVRGPPVALVMPGGRGAEGRQARAARSAGESVGGFAA